jgi:hypothetical protein
MPINKISQVRAVWVERITLIASLIIRVLIPRLTSLWMITVVVVAIHEHHILLGFRAIIPGMPSVATDLTGHMRIYG